MSKYVTTNEAAKLMNMTPRSVRRKVSALSPELSAYVRKTSGKILVDIRLVKGEFKKIVDDSQEQETTQDHQQATDSKLTAILTDQLKEKDKQIAALTERNRELNIIIANMQREREQLQLMPGERPQHPTEQPEKTEQNRTPTKRDTTNFILLAFAFVALILIVLALLDVI